MESGAGQVGNMMKICITGSPGTAFPPDKIACRTGRPGKLKQPPFNLDNIIVCFRNKNFTTKWKHFCPIWRVMSSHRLHFHITVCTKLWIFCILYYVAIEKLFLKFMNINSKCADICYPHIIWHIMFSCDSLLLRFM